MFKVVSFYTEGTGYEEEAKQLIQTLNKFNLDYKIYPVKSRGDWALNAGIKPEIILDALNDFPEHDILYVDADARIRKYPELFDNFDGDMGVHYRHGRELLSGTIFFKNTEASRSLVSMWVAIQSNNPLVWDQKVLHNAITKYKKPLKVIDLPPSYTQIFDTMKHHGEPVIEHYQASRKFRRTITETADVKRIPPIIAGRRPRLQSNGTFILPRVDAKLEKKLSKDYVRIKNEDIWYPRYNGISKNFINLFPVFTNKNVYIVGKGPSLDTLTKDDFPGNLPIICLNESIKTVENLGLENQLYALQQDHELGCSCQPESGDILVSFRARRAYEGFNNKYVYYPEEYNCTRTTLSVLVAMSIATKFGATGFILLAHDAMKNGNCDYAAAIGYEPEDYGRGGRLRFKNHKNRVINLASTLKVSIEIR